MKTQKEIRSAFWEMLETDYPELRKQKRSNKTQNDYCTDIRVLFCDYCEQLRRNGEISENLAKRVTL